MAHEVLVEQAAPRPFASIRSTTPRPELGAEIVRLLDEIWPFLREHEVRTGHNLVVYHGGNQASLDVEVGVETFTDMPDHDEVRRSHTPSGEVATTAHYGDYAEMAPAYAALEEWCERNGRPQTGVSWEVYGDWDDDPTKRRTDLFFLLRSTE